MNQQQAAEAYSIPNYTYTEDFKTAVRELENTYRNFERAMNRMVDRGKTNRREGSPSA